LTFTSPMRMPQFLARMVMPRSRSWSLESMMRPCWPPTSLSSSSVRNRPDWRSIWSTRVGLAVVDVGDHRDVSDVGALHGTC